MFGSRNAKNLHIALACMRMITHPYDLLVLRPHPCPKIGSSFNGIEIPPTHLPTIGAKTAWHSPVDSLEDGHLLNNPVFGGPQRSVNAATTDLPRQRPHSLVMAAPKEGLDSCGHE